MLPTPEGLFAARLAADPAAPLVTFYDDATGERAELSAKSLGNWIAKTHFLLMDELGLGVGDRAVVSLPEHWLAVPVLLGCWFAGLEVRTADPAASVAFATADRLPGLDVAAVPDVFAVSMLSMARPDQPPAGAADYAASVRPMPDAWATVHAVAGPSEACLDGLTRAEVAAAAQQRAGHLGLQTGGRLLWTRPWGAPANTVADWIDALLAPLAVGGSVVLVRNADPAKAGSRAEAERVTVQS